MASRSTRDYQAVKAEEQGRLHDGRESSVELARPSFGAAARTLPQRASLKGISEKRGPIVPANLEANAKFGNEPAIVADSQWE